MGQGAKSKANLKEAEMLVGICKYLIAQHNGHSSITILTTYVGQLILIRQIMQDEGVGMVEATTVDNFQGEENDIILLSLVRSNEEGVTGFLNVANRVVVALSRARKGFYCVGDVSMLAASAPRVWAPVVQLLASAGRIGDGLPLALNPVVYDETGAEVFDEESSGDASNGRRDADLGPSAIRRTGQGGFGVEHLHGNLRAAEGRAAGGKAKVRSIPDHLVQQSDGHRCKYARMPEDFDGWLREQARMLERVDKLREGSSPRAAAGAKNMSMMNEGAGGYAGGAGGVGGHGGDDFDDWVSVVDEQTGQQYWYHKYNRSTTWQNPATFAEPMQQHGQHMNSNVNGISSNVNSHGLSDHGMGNGMGNGNGLYNNGMDNGMGNGMDNGMGNGPFNGNGLYNNGMGNGGMGNGGMGKVRFSGNGSDIEISDPRKARREAKRDAKRAEKREDKRKEKETRSRAKADAHRAKARKRQKKKEKQRRKEATRAGGGKKEKHGSAYVRNSKGEQVKLPPGWKCHRNSSGRTFFRNKEFNQSTYFHPITGKKTRRKDKRPAEAGANDVANSSSGSDVGDHAAEAGQDWGAGDTEMPDVDVGGSGSSVGGSASNSDDDIDGDDNDNSDADGVGGAGTSSGIAAALVQVRDDECVPLTSV
jgi:hypothetical protein